MEHNTFGRHVLAEIKGADFEVLNDAPFIVNALIEASKKAGATVMSHNTVMFEPQGCSAVVVLSESHVTIHTFPEHNYASFDAYTCGHLADPMVILDNVIRSLGAYAEYKLFIRGGTAGPEQIESGLRKRILPAGVDLYA